MRRSWPVRRNEWRHHYTGNLLLLAPSTHLTHQAQVQIFIIERIIICVMESWCQHEHSHRSHKSSPAPLIMELWHRRRLRSGWCQSPVWANDDNDSNVRGCDWQLPASASQPPSLWWEETAQPHNNQRRRGQKMRPASILLTQLLRTFNAAFSFQRADLCESKHHSLAVIGVKVTSFRQNLIDVNIHEFTDLIIL